MIPEIDIDEFAARREAGAAVLDVREPSEYAEAHVPGAWSIPLGELEARAAEIPSGAPLLVICRSGACSMRACEWLATTGREATNVTGGTLAWISSGRSVATGDERG